MTSETNAEFLDRLEATPRYNPAYRTLDSDRLFDLARRVADAAARIAQLEAALRAAYEVYAGSDGFVPETCAEGYQQQIITQMVDCISAALEASDDQ